MRTAGGPVQFTYSALVAVRVEGAGLSFIDSVILLI